MPASFASPGWTREEDVVGPLDQGLRARDVADGDGGREWQGREPRVWDGRDMVLLGGGADRLRDAAGGGVAGRALRGPQDERHQQRAAGRGAPAAGPGGRARRSARRP